MHTWIKDVHCLHYLYQLITCNSGQKKTDKKKQQQLLFLVCLFVCLFWSVFLASICNWATVYKVNLSIYILFACKLLHANVYMRMYTLSYSLVRARPPPYICSSVCVQYNTRKQSDEPQNKLKGGKAWERGLHAQSHSS